MTRPRVAVVEPYLARYRVPLYRQLAVDLRARGVDLVVAHGQATGAQARRTDGVSVPGAVVLRQRSLRVGRRELLWRELGELASSVDVLVLDQALRNLENHLWLGRRRGPAVALFGHGGTYTVAQGRLARAAKRGMTRGADWFFAYTDAGGEDVVRDGFPRARVTVVRNAVDTGEVAGARERVTEREMAEFRARHGLVVGRTCLFLGGFDAAKRIPLLVAAVERIERQLPGFRLLMAGDGELRELVRGASAVVDLGPVARAEDKALLGAVSELLLMPGRVGLCAVDSFALRTPVVTAEWPFHSVEFEYLEHGRNAWVVRGGEREFAAAVVELLRDGERVERLRAGCVEDAARYTVEGMSERFADGLERLLALR
ncbi:glycosyltransferase family 4 protein [Streptomyces sp. NPDC059009]|uniref:glycosyltransferase family 4 protein n=1 Tax=Streptomyces sp. NPDC059009 TaxID=3346694 RepID=UPI0036D00F00